MKGKKMQIQNCEYHGREVPVCGYCHNDCALCCARRDDCSPLGDEVFA